MKARLNRALCLLVMTVAICVVFVPAASAATWTGYCYKWTPHGNAKLKGTTRLVVDAPDSGAKTTYIASNSKTRFYFRDDTAGWQTGTPRRVTRNKFFALARANRPDGRPEITVTVKWAWKRDAHGKRYRYPQSITGSYYQS
jgi:hypothetical protein